MTEVHDPRDPRDERRHDPGDAATWSEWWQLDYVADEVAGFVRLAMLPNANVAWYWAYVVTPEYPGPVVVRDHDVALPRGVPLEVRADGLWAECTCEVPFEHWTYGLEAFGVRLDDPLDALHGEIGERLPVGFDLEWEVLSAVLGGPPHYSQAGTVHGEVLLGRRRIEVRGDGTRTHGWAEVPWVAGSTNAPFPAELDDDGLPRTGGDVAVDHVVVVPLDGYPGPATRVVRALCTTAETARGWVEWVQ